MNSNVSKAFLIGLGLILAPLQGQARPSGLWFRHCDSIGELAKGIMIMRKAGATLDTTQAAMYGSLSENEMYEGDDFRLVHGIVAGAFNWPIVSDADQSEILTAFAAATIEVCSKMASPNWSPDVTVERELKP